MSPMTPPWDKQTEAAVETAINARRPVVLDNTTNSVTWRAALFSIVFLLLQFAEEGLKLIDLPAEWAILITTLATGILYVLRQAFLTEMQKRGG